ncbi:MAG: zinc ribbon domain-containing protein [Thermoanaerobaculia bacterium]
MQSLKCPSCGAPLEFDDDSVITTCSHCGASLAPTQFLKTGRKPKAPQIQVVRVEVPRYIVRPRKRSLAATIAALLMVAVFALLISMRSQSVQRSLRETFNATRSSFPANAKTLLERKEVPLPVAKLAEPGFSGRHQLASAPPMTPFAAFEPVSNLPWALSIAQVWSKDVKLERLDVDRVRPDGTTNVQDDGDASVTYRFVSPSRVLALLERRNLEKDPHGDQEFWVEIEGGQVYANEISTMAVFTDDDTVAEVKRLTWPRSVSLKEIVPTVTRRKGMQSLPFFNGYLIFIEDEGWSWYISTLSGSPDIPRIRARDGRFWPD